MTGQPVRARSHRCPGHRPRPRRRLPVLRLSRSAGARSRRLGRQPGRRVRPMRCRGPAPVAWRRSFAGSTTGPPASDRGRRQRRLDAGNRARLRRLASGVVRTGATDRPRSDRPGQDWWAIPIRLGPAHPAQHGPEVCRGGAARALPRAPGPDRPDRCRGSPRASATGSAPRRPGSTRAPGTIAPGAASRTSPPDGREGLGPAARLPRAGLAARRSAPASPDRAPVACRRVR